MPYTENTYSEITTTTTEQTGCCSSSDLKFIFPKGIIDSQKISIMRLLSQCPDKSQQIIDELAGRMKIEEVKNPVGYIKGILKNIENEPFDPELALGIAETRDAYKKRNKDLKTKLEKIKHQESSGAVESATDEIKNLRNILNKCGEK